jgi:PAS domain S-box-containing protein
MQTSTQARPARILVVEDEAIVALDIRAELESMAYEVCGIADTADRALALARATRPGLALVDIRLKGPVDGITLAGQLRQELHVPVIFLTSYSDEENVLRATQTMPFGYLTKPFQAKELRAAITIALHNAEVERRLHASEQRFRSAFGHAPLPMAIMGVADGRYLEMNDAMRRLLGAEGRPLDDLRHADLSLADETPLEDERLAELRAGRAEFVQFEKHYRPLAGGATVPTLVSVSLLPGNGVPASFLYQAMDLTAQKQAAEQQARLEAERVRSAAAELAAQVRNEFLSRMSHELRTPLNAIMGFAQLLQLRGSTEGSGHYVDHILQAGKHLVELVDDVLALQRAVAGKLPQHPEPTSLRDSVERAIELLSPSASELDVRMVCEVPGDLIVMADRLRLRQVLLNLGSNAVKYNRRGGTVFWRARRFSGGRICLHVRDTGQGIAPSAMGKLFQPFERLGQQNSPTPGTGLGLVIARNLLEEMGASLTVTSEQGQGTTVSIVFPASSLPAPTPQAPPR